MLFAPIFTKGIKAKRNQLESGSDIFPQNEGKVGKSELTPVVKALTNCALIHWLTKVRYRAARAAKNLPRLNLLSIIINLIRSGSLPPLIIFSKWLSGFWISTVGELYLCGAFGAFNMYHGSSFMAFMAGSFYQERNLLNLASWSHPDNLQFGGQAR